MNPARKKAYILLITATAIWGIAGPVIKYTLGGIDALTFLVYRFAISSILAIIVFPKLTFKLPKEPKVIWWLILNSFFSSTVALGLLFFGMENTTVLDSALITLISPLLVAGSGVRFLNERITLREKIGMGIALLGTLFIVIEPLFLGSGGETRTSGNSLILLYLLATIVPAILTKKLLREKVNPLTITNMEFLIGFITLLPFAIYKHGGFEIITTIKNLEPQFHLGVFFMALLSGSLAYYLYNRAQKTIEVGEVAVFAYLHPLFSAPIAVLWLGEKINSQFIAGAVTIAIGVIVAEYKSTKLSKVEKEAS